MRKSVVASRYTPPNAIAEAQSAWVSPVYDSAGNMTEGPKPGSLADGATRHHYVWDAWNRLVQIQADAEGDPGDIIATYRYACPAPLAGNGQHHRIVKLVRNAADDWDRTDYCYESELSINHREHRGHRGIGTWRRKADETIPPWLRQ